MMMTPLFLLSYALILPLVAHGTTINSCAVILGCVLVSAGCGEMALLKGKVVIKILYHGILLRTETHDICEEMSCPNASGDFTLTHTQNLPAFAPPGLYTLKITVEEDESNQQLTCISFNIRIGFGLLTSDC